MNDIQKTVDTVLAEMARLTITTERDMVVAAEWLRSCKAAQKAVEEHYDGEKKATWGAYQLVMGNIKKLAEPLAKAETAVKRMLSAYQQKVEQERRAERLRLEAEARKREEERRLQEAITTGDEKILDEPVEAPVIVQERVTRVEGVSYVDHYTFKVVNLDLVPREYMMLDEKKVGGVVRAMKAQTAIPGIEVVVEKTVRGRA